MKPLPVKSILLSCFVFITYSFGYAQYTKQTIWDVTYGGDQDDLLEKIIATHDGQLLLAGTSSSDISEDKASVTKGGKDLWLVKTDLQGNLVLEKTIGGSNHDTFADLIATSDGGYLLGATSLSNAYADKSENSRGKTDYWVIKLDGQLNIEWEKTYGSQQNDDLAHLMQTPDGGFLLSGRSDGSAFAEKSELGYGGYDYWVIKTDTQGTIAWDKSYGGNNGDNLREAIVTSDNNYLLVGTSAPHTSGNKNASNTSSTFGQPWVVKITPQGTMLWDRVFSINGAPHEILKLDGGLLNTPDGGFLIGANSYHDSSGTPYLFKLNNQGIKDWHQQIPSALPGTHHLVKQIEEYAQGYLITGSTSASVQSNNQPVMTYDAWLAKTDVLGNLEWEHKIIDYLYDFGDAGLVLADGFLTGGGSRPDFGNPSIAEHQDLDYRMVKTQVTPLFAEVGVMVAGSSFVINLPLINELAEGVMKLNCKLQQVDTDFTRLEGIEIVQYESTETRSGDVIYWGEEGITYTLNDERLESGLFRFELQQVVDRTEGPWSAPIFFSTDERPVVVIYPNPSPERFTVRIQGTSEKETGKIEVLNERGEVIEHAEFNGRTELEFDLSGWETGIYYVQTTLGKEKYTDRIVLK